MCGCASRATSTPACSGAPRRSRRVPSWRGSDAMTASTCRPPARGCRTASAPPYARARSRSAAALTDALQVKVVDVVEETGDARSLVLESPEPLTYTSGQFLTVAVPSDRTGLVARCYSLSSAPHESDLLKITVKRTADGYGSNWICDNVKTGHQLTVLPPSGIFSPKSFDDDLLLFAGGSGITPVISIAKTALATGGGKVVLLYANRDESSVIFA